MGVFCSFPVVHQGDFLLGTKHKVFRKPFVPVKFALRQNRSTNILSNHATIRGDVKRSPTIKAPGLIVALGIVDEAPVAHSTEWPLVVVPVASSFK